MRKHVAGVLAACALIFCCATGCTDKPKATAVETVATDSVADTVAADPMEELISEAPVSEAVDELFDDFFFNFAGNRKLQMQRISFPLTVNEGGTTKKISKAQWKMERFFMPQGFYTLILDNLQQLELSKDTSISHAVVEKIYLDRKRVKAYNFDRSSGRWMLVSIDEQKTADHNNASFLAFYERFATDSAFQMQSLHDPIIFTGPDPDDDFNTLTGELFPEQWPMVGPEDLPADVIYNIIYGQQYTESTQKILLLRGIANGQEVEMTFKKTNGHWLLTHLTE